MQLPDRSADLEQAKHKILVHLKEMQDSLYDYVTAIANSGFADKRMCVIAQVDFDKAFLEMGNALRIGTPNQYAKAPGDSPPPASFTPPTDPSPERNVAETRSIEWRDHKAS